MSGPFPVYSVVRDHRYDLSPASDRIRRRERLIARAEVAVEAIALGFAIAALLFALPFLGLMFGAALGIDMGGGLQ